MHEMVTSHTLTKHKLFGEGPKALTWIKGVFHWPKANLEWKTPRYWSRCDQ